MFGDPTIADAVLDRLVDRAIGVGWPHERVQVIDEDLGKSGAGSVERHGLVTEHR